MDNYNEDIKIGWLGSIDGTQMMAEIRIDDEIQYCAFSRKETEAMIFWMNSWLRKTETAENQHIETEFAQLVHTIENPEN